MEMRPMFRSKALKTAGYDPATRVLRLRFRHGGLYDYFGVEARVHEDLMTSAHPWTELRMRSRRTTTHAWSEWWSLGDSNP